MVTVRFLLCLVFVGLVSLPALAQRPESSYKAGVRAEAKGHLDAAYLAFKLAHDKKPSEPKYLASYLKARLYASSDHVKKGQSLRDVYKLPEALEEFRRAAEIDSSNFSAFQEIRRTEDLIQRAEAERNLPVPTRTQLSQLEKQAASAAGPVTISFPTNNDITLHLVTTTDMVYRTLGKLGGFNVLIDPEYKPQKIQLELKDVTLRDALSMVALQSKTFWRPVSSNTILVTADNSGKRKEMEQNVMRTFYLKNASTPSDLQQAASTLKGILDITRIQTTPEQRSLTIRGTPDQMVLAQKLLMDIDKPRAEVMIEIAVLEVSKGRIQTLGINPPTTFSGSLQPTGSTSTSTTGTTTTTSTASSGFTLNSLAHLTAENIQISIPGASLTALLSDSNTKVLQKPQIRAMDSEKATLKIGDRIPIATGSFQSGLSNGVNTQFTYIDVGVNVDIVPYVHSNREVTLKMSFEISSVTGQESVDGVTEPTIGQRRIEHQARLRDGEVNLIGGILQDTESHSLSGYPFLAKIPLLKYLFGQENKDHQQSEIVFAITPHIIRSTEVIDDNEKMVDIGTGTSVAYRTIQSSEELDKPVTPAVTGTPVPQSAPPTTKAQPLGSSK